MTSETQGEEVSQKTSGPSSSPNPDISPESANNEDKESEDLDGHNVPDSSEIHSSSAENSSDKEISSENNENSSSEKSSEAEEIRDNFANSQDKQDLQDNESLPPNIFADQAQEDTAKEQEDEEQGMGLLDHLNELRGRLVKACIAIAVCFGICWAFVDPLFEILFKPLLAVLPEGTHAQYTTLPEAFFTRMYIAFVASIFLASPFIFYQIWAFVAPGLYEEEKRYIIPIALLSAIFFTGGAIFCYFIVFPFAFNFFISYSTPEIVITPKVSDYLSFVIKLLIAFGLIFEMPIFTLFLSRLGILTAAMMRKGRRYAIVIIFILAAILTPPDVVSQLLMACPMLLLYELSIGVAAIFGRKKKSKNDQDTTENNKDNSCPSGEKP